MLCSKWLEIRCISWNFDKMIYAASELQMVLTTFWSTQQPGKTLQDHTPYCNASTLCSTERNCKTSHSASRSPQRQQSHCPHCNMLWLMTSKKKSHSLQVTKMAESYCFQAKALSHISGSCLFSKSILKPSFNRQVITSCVIAERLSTRHLILQYNLATHCMYVCQSRIRM